MVQRTDLFIWITIAEIAAIILAIVLLPRLKKTMVSMILVLGNIGIFVTHVIFDSSILSGNISFMGSSSGGSVHLAIWDALGFRVSDFLKGQDMWGIVTSLFVHANIVHLLMNMIVLLFLGVPFEQKIGSRNFAVLFFSAGIGAALMKVIFIFLFGGMAGINPNVNGIGASGAIFGVLGAFVAIYPKEKVMFPLFIFIRPWPVFLIALLYGGMETLSVVGGVKDGVGHITHLNGLLIGLAAALVMKRMGLFQKKQARALVTIEILREMVDAMEENEEEKKTLARIEEEDMADIRNAWIEHLLESAHCPRCGKKVDLSAELRQCKCGYVDLGPEKKKR